MTEYVEEWGRCGNGKTTSARVRVRRTPQLKQVLRAFLENPTASRYGYELMKSVSMASGVLYPILARMEKGGLVVSFWENPERRPGVPPRRYYQLTDDGITFCATEWMTS